MSEKTPNPGSNEAVKQGCTCPRMDNGWGRDSGRGDGRFIYNCECPLHGNGAVARLLEAVSEKNS